VRIHQGIPPAELPDTPQRFQLMSPFKGSGLPAVAAASGQALEVPTYDGAIVTATARDTSMGRYGAYFSPSWTPFQPDGGRDFSVIMDGVSI
jgi:hypothetical protein